MSHPEWKTNNSLTAPGDFDVNTPKDPPTTLTESEVKDAFQDLVISDFVNKYPRNEKYFADPIYHNQVYTLHSFVPAKGAKPNSKGVYGMVKFRGSFPTLEEANERAEWIIRNADSYHSIYTGYCGRPFPLAFNPNYVSETNEVDIKQQVVETVSHDLKSRREKEKRELEEIKEREKKLLAESQGPEDPYETYTTLRVKKAQLTWTYKETMAKMEQMKESIIKAREEIEKMDKEDVNYSKEYMDRYMKAREESGLKTDMENSFIRYMVEDVDIGF
jgi:hypothetical protein